MRVDTASSLVCVVASLFSGLAANGQSRAKPWAAPLTPDGHPDLQGNWVNRSATPLERPKQLQGRQFLTDSEVGRMKRWAERYFRDDHNDFAAREAFFLAALANFEQYKNANATGGSDQMIELEIDNRTSLIVDPPDGRLPPYTPAGQRRKSASDAADVMQNPPAGPEDLTNYQRCLTFGVPMVDPGQYSYFQVCRLGITLWLSWKPSMMPGSFRWMGVRIFHGLSVSGAGIRSASGRVKLWSSLLPTFLPRVTSGDRLSTCSWSTVSRVFALANTSTLCTF